MTQTAKGNIKVIGFDVVTIFNPFSVDAVIEENFPGKGAQLASAWRTRIFESCWQRALNRTYVDFWQVLDDALTFAFKAELKLDARAKGVVVEGTFKASPDAARLSRATLFNGRSIPVAYFEAHTYFGSNSRDAIALANKVAGGQPPNFGAWAKASFAIPATA